MGAVVPFDAEHATMFIALVFIQVFLHIDGHHVSENYSDSIEVGVVFVVKGTD